jgi:pantothenate kinase
VVFSVFLNLLRLGLCHGIWSYLEEVPWAAEKNVYCTLVGWNALLISINSNYSIVSINSGVSLLFFVLSYLLVRVGYWSLPLSLCWGLSMLLSGCSVF